MRKHTFTLNLASFLICIVLGSLIGWLGGNASVLLVWALIGLVLGSFSAYNRASLANGAAYGFAVAYSFMLSGYDGQQTLVSRLLPFVVFGIVGAICGMVLGFVGYQVRNRVQSIKNTIDT